MGSFLEAKTFVQVNPFAPDPHTLSQMGGPPMHSAHFSVFSSTFFGSESGWYGTDMITVEQSFPRRLFNFALALGMRGLLAPYVEASYKAVLPPQYQQYVDTAKRTPDLSIYLQVEGLYPPVPLPLNVKVVYPKFHQQLGVEELRLGKELEWFYSLNEKVVLVAFGSAMYPTNHTMSEILRFIQLKRDYAFLIAVKEA